MKPDLPRSLAASRYQIATSVRAVLFDAVGTLMMPQPDVAEAYLAAGQRFGSRLDLEQVRTRFRDAFGRQERLDADHADGQTSEARERRRWESIVAEVFSDVGAPEALFESLWDHFAQAHHWRLFDDVSQAWTRLLKANLQLGVASNFDARLESILGAMPLDVPAERVFVSSQLGCRKPCKKFFRSIEHMLGLAADQLLLVGDDLDSDYCGARVAGWHAVLLCRSGMPPPEVEHGITSLDELDIASYET